MAAVLGALAGALATAVGAFVTARSSERIHKKQARRQAYTSFLTDLHALRQHLIICTEMITLRGPAGVASQGSAMLDRLDEIKGLLQSLDRHLVTVALEGPDELVIDAAAAMAHALALRNQLYEWLIDVQRTELPRAEVQGAMQLLTELEASVGAVQRVARRHL
ncbi:hypothetical protein AB0O47_07360 [Streptomyces noursei]|uniref:hypothetical protein n=1 Tax=Streptomyces noursei TaxID=1971 RepID=UPI00345001B4